MILPANAGVLGGNGRKNPLSGMMSGFNGGGMGQG